MIIKIEVLAPGPRPPCKRDVNKNICTINKVLMLTESDQLSLSQAEITSLKDTLSILRGIKEQLPEN